jgi:hypothetical protein
LTAEDITTPGAGRRRRAKPQQLRRGGIEDDDTEVTVDGDDRVARTLEDRCQRGPLAGQGTAELGGPEGDRQLAPDEREVASMAIVKGPVRPGSDARKPMAERSMPSRPTSRASSSWTPDQP